MKVNLEIVPTIIILLISATAFASGFYQSNLNNQVNNLNDEITNLKQDQTRINNKYSAILQEWEADTVLGQESYDQAKSIDNQVVLLNSTLTAQQINTYLYSMMPYWRELLASQEDLILVQLQRYFEYNSTLGPYIIATQKTDGYDYNITLDMWNSWQTNVGTNVVTQTSIADLINNYFSDGGLFTSFLLTTPKGIWNYASNDNQTFLLKTRGTAKLDYIFLAPSRELTTLINQKQSQINDLENRVKLVSQGVIIVSIATILGGIMVNRISDKNNNQTFNEIKKSLNIISELPQQHKDLISLPVLLIAGILSIFGLLLPLLI